MANGLNHAVMRFSHPLAFRSYLNQIGAPSQRYFRRQQLPDLCEDSSAIIPLRKAWSFFHDAAVSTDRDIGWHVGRHVGDTGLNGSTISRIESASTLNLALRRFVKLIKVEASHLQLGIIQHPERILFYTHYAGLKNEPGYHVSQAYQLAVYIDLVRHFAGVSWVPPEIGIEAGEVPECVHELFPGSRMRVNQPIGYISVPRGNLRSSLCIQHNNYDPCEKALDGNELNFADLMACLLKPYLRQGYPSMDLAASLAGVSKRTLTRRLADCGKSYQGLIDEIRFEKAAELLKDTERHINDIAWSVGFSDQGNFTRMFRRIAGTSPKTFRKSEAQPNLN